LVVANKRCSVCGESFGCGADSPGTACWCGEFPPVIQPEPGADCLCPKCLKAAVVEKIGELSASAGPEDPLVRIAADHRPDAGPIEGIDYYVNDDGLFVFTRWYLLKRGFCCKNGCRHCPYGFSQTPA